MNNWKAKVITSMPEMFPGPLSHSIIGRSLKEKKWSLETINLRDFSYDKRGSIDDTPFGGGSGMILRADVAEKAVKKSLENMENNFSLVYMTPVGKPLVQQKLEEYSNSPGLIILCGRFEGVDERVLEAYDFERISIGDFVIAGGEIAAMTVIEGCVRLLPGVIGKKESLEIESFNNNLLEYPQYTRPDVWVDKNGVEHNVPEVLLSGHHKKINDWRNKKSIENTKKYRAELLKK